MTALSPVAKVRAGVLLGLLVTGLSACGGDDGSAPAVADSTSLPTASPADGMARAAAALLRQNRPRGALALLRRAAVADSQSAAVHYNTGVALMQIGELKAAEAAFRRALRWEPESPHELLGLAAALRAGHRDAEAMPLLRRALGLEPARVDLRFDLARALIEVGESEAALAHLDSALALDNGHAPSLYWRGHLRLHMGRLSEAVNDLERAVDLAPVDVEALLDLGIAYVEMGRPREALSVLGRARQLDARNPRVLYGLSRAHGELGQPAARDSLLHLFDRLSRSVELLGAGRRLAAIGDEDEALAAWRRATASDSTLAEALVESGRAWLRRGILDSARASFESALVRAPDDVAARIGLARTHLDAGRPDRALDLARSVLASDGENRDAHYCAGAAMAQTGRLKGAEIHLRRAIELEPEFVDGHLALSRYLELQGDSLGAEHYRDRARALSPRQEPAPDGSAAGDPP